MESMMRKKKEEQPVFCSPKISSSSFPYFANIEKLY